MTAIERAEDAIFKTSKQVQWLCKCDCGKETIVLAGNLKKAVSCGCGLGKKSSLQDLTNKKFGLLTVLERAENQILPSGQRQTMWKCKCECGSIVIVRGTHLKDGLTRSCGCLKSQGEKDIADYLSQHNVDFCREYEFDDCCRYNGNKLPFDFAIFDKKTLFCLIEYQGEQHYKESKSAPSFGKLQREETDKIKIDYCKRNHIVLYTIKYNEDLYERLSNILSDLHGNTVPNIA